jgi:hypothetical protein
MVSTPESLIFVVNASTLYFYRLIILEMKLESFTQEVDNSFEGSR